jgi:hypothetical protein
MARAAARKEGGSRTVRAAGGAFLCLALGLATAALAGDGALETAGRRLRLAIEVRGNLRDSEANRFPSPFPFRSDQLPVGQRQAFLSTVDPGEHAELALVSLRLDADLGRRVAGRLKIDAIDLYDRNPTSTDREIDLDEAWLRWGEESAPAALPASRSAYVKFGKFGKFERQDDRHLESYGLAATAFNRFEDAGLEVGADLGRHAYAKLSWTAGNPVFLRDPNALAGDNGTAPLGRAQPDNVPELGTGIDILYDAEIESLDLGQYAESGAALGLRFADDSGGRAVDAMVWRYQRKLAPRAKLHGTFYGGDLDTLDGPFANTALPIRGDAKRETGANLWIYLGGLSLFAQAVDQEIAGMSRSGYDIEAAWTIDLPLVWALAGRQLFPSIQPALRYSKLDPDFDGGSPVFPAPSLRWEWTKQDLGLRVAILPDLDVTFEQNRNEFILGNGSHRRNDETLLTVRWRYGR